MVKTVTLIRLSHLPNLKNDKEVYKVYDILCKSLNAYSKAYYDTGEPLISDSEYDKMYAYLHTAENLYPDIVKPYSPTQNVGAKPDSNLVEKEYKHKTKMYSLGNVYDTEEFGIWYDTITKKFPNVVVPLSIEYKIDGLSLKLVYEQGELTHAALRGDGKVGADILHAVKGIVSGIPSRLVTRPQEDDAWASLRGIDIGVPEYIEVKGELYIDPIDLPKINKRRVEEGKIPYATARNAASGLVNARTCQDLRFIAHGIEKFATSDRISSAFTTTSKWMSGIENTFNFRTAVYSTQRQNSLEDVLLAIKDIGEHRKDKDFPMDGAVIKVTDFNMMHALGYTRKIPKWAIAYKYPAEEATTTLLGVMWTIGRTGTLTPVAVFKPISIGGVTIAKATLHNAARIKELDLHQGDTIFVVRSGDVIPEVTSVVKAARASGATAIPMPILCPCCSTPIIHDGSSIKCPNSLCKDRVKASLTYSCSKSLLNISALGPSTIATLVDADCIHGIFDILSLNKEKIDNIYAVNGKSSLADAIVKSIDKVRPTWNMETCLCALNIPKLNRRASQILAKYYGNFYSMFASQDEEDNWIKLVGSVTAKSIKDNINDPVIFKNIAAFEQYKI